MKKKKETDMKPPSFLLKLFSEKIKHLIIGDFALLPVADMEYMS